jgi:hypothetical protein
VQQARQVLLARLVLIHLFPVLLVQQAHKVFKGITVLLVRKAFKGYKVTQVK